jgi:hypothetical protein
MALFVAPGASVAEVALSADALKSVVSLSLAVKLNVSLAHPLVSLLVIVKV